MPESGGIGEVELRAGVVAHDPGEHGVLRDVHEAAAGLAVEVHQVVEVGHLPAHPILHPAS